jgi:hypothetical protein
VVQRADGAHDAADLPHRRRGLDIVTDHISDDQQCGTAGLHERVIPVAADRGGLRGGHVADHDL